MTYNTIHNSGKPSTDQIIGVLVGQAVGDALGATYEFGPSSAFSQTFECDADVEMRGGGSFAWGVGEFTDDTQMAVILAESIVYNGAFDENDVFSRWSRWAKTARDVGGTTMKALSQPDLRRSREVMRSSGGNGCGAVMRVGPVGLMPLSDTTTEWVARSQGLITHPDSRTVESAVIAALLVKRLIGMDQPPRLSEDLYDIVDDIIVQHVSLDMSAWAASHFSRTADVAGNNFEGHHCLAQAIRAVALSDSYLGAIRGAIDMGGDADSVAAVAGAIAGAMYGVSGIPARLATKVHGYIPEAHGNKMRRIGLEDLYALASNVAERGWRKRSPDYGGVVKPVFLWRCADTDFYASNLAGAATVDPDEFGVISLCRTFGELDHINDRVQFYLVDSPQPESNPNLEVVVEDIMNEVSKMMCRKKKILIHCHAGVSRTGFVAKLVAMEWLNLTHSEAHDRLFGIYHRYQMSNPAFTEYLSEKFGDVS
ncbi:MAG: ADP-ribosylglycohydrolase family protein [Pontimonas sp.]